MENHKYSGFWTRFWAMLLDSNILFFIISSILYLFIYIFIYFINGDDFLLKGDDFLLKSGEWEILINLVVFIFIISFIILFWKYKSATPGKMLFKIKIVDAISYKNPSMKQYIIRFLGYFISGISSE